MSSTFLSHPDKHRKQIYPANYQKAKNPPSEDKAKRASINETTWQKKRKKEEEAVHVGLLYFPRETHFSQESVLP